MRPARLKLHHNYLTNFDFIDKELQNKKVLLTIPKLNTLIARSKIDQANCDKHTILKALALELFGNQKFSTTKTDKIFSKKLFFKTTLRKENLFLFLDSCLNTIFLHEYKLWTWDNIRIENKLHFYLGNNLINNFNIISTQLRYSLQLSNSFLLSNRTDEDRFFYLIPIRKVRKLKEGE